MINFNCRYGIGQNSRETKDFFEYPSSQQFIKLFHGKPGLFNNCTKSSFGYLFVVGNYKTTVGICSLSENDVGALLSILSIPKLRQSRNHFST